MARKNASIPSLHLHGFYPFAQRYSSPSSGGDRIPCQKDECHNNFRRHNICFNADHFVCKGIYVFYVIL